MYVTLLVCYVVLLSAQAPPSREYQIKAVFLFNFTQFVEWPVSAYPVAGTPIVIGVLGEDPFGAYLDEVVTGEEVKGHPLVIQRFNSVDEVKTCHILFINIADADKLERVIDHLKGRSILTVSDAASFMRQGGMIRFITEDQKIRFQVNPEVTKADSLTISSKMLRLAEIVIPGKMNN